MNFMLKRILEFLDLLGKDGRISWTNLITVNFVVAVTYRCYVFENIGAGEVLSLIGALGSYQWKKHRLSKEAKDWLER